MLKVSDLWIGDEVILLKSGRVGKFQGIQKDGKVKILLDGKNVLTTLQNLSLPNPEDKALQMEIVVNDLLADIEEKEKKSFNSKIKNTDNPEKVINKTLVLKNQTKFNTLDLHINVLNPELEGQSALKILEFQISQFEEFLNFAITKGLPHITIIHGKGEGVLMNEVLLRLKQHPQLALSKTINNGGATEAWFRNI